MAPQPEKSYRVRCRNAADEREWFTLAHNGEGIVITTPGALTRTSWNREQAARLRDVLAELLGEQR